MNDKIRDSIVRMINNINSEKLLLRIHNLVQLIYMRN